MRTTILRLYFANFFIGLVFWYGIEKLFMQSIGVDATPSAVRTSILSVLSSLGRSIAIPASIFIGWIISQYDVYFALRFVSIIALIALLYWLWQRFAEHVGDELVES